MWDKLNAADIQELLNGADDETFFFEFSHSLKNIRGFRKIIRKYLTNAVKNVIISVLAMANYVYELAFAN